MSDESKLRISHVAENSDGCALHVQRILSADSFDHLKPTSLAEALAQLEQGDTDLVAMSGISAFMSDLDGFVPTSGFDIAAVLARREPTCVLVSPDKPEYLPRNAVVSVPSRLIARQLRKLRPDLKLKIGVQHPSNLFYSSCDASEIDDYCSAMESSTLDGFVLERAVWDSAGLKTRRHTLGVNIEGEQNRIRFIPPPLRGFSLLIARPGFPLSLIAENHDPIAFEVWKTESAITRRVLYLGDLIGLFVQVRRSNTILKTAESEDTLISEWWHDSTRTRPTHMLEMFCEILGPRGRISVSLEKRFPLEEAHHGTEVFMKEWTELLELATMGHQADIRLGDAAPALLELEEE